MKMNSKILPPTYFWILFFLSIGMHFLFPVKQMIYVPYAYFGFVLITVGILLNIWPDSLLKKEKTTVKPHETPSNLITAGPFRISRHPMYLGMDMILLDLSIFLGSLITFVFPISFIILMELMFIPFEEQNLERIFGKKYFEYNKKIRRWI